MTKTSGSTGPQDTGTHLFQKVAGDGLVTKKFKLLIRQVQAREAGQVKSELQNFDK